jgi:hypothetical protein
MSHLIFDVYISKFYILATGLTRSASAPVISAVGSTTAAENLLQVHSATSSVADPEPTTSISAAPINTTSSEGKDGEITNNSSGEQNS